MGRLVVVEREPARPLPRPLPLLLRVLHAALLGRPGPAAREHERGLRALRGRADPGLVPRDPARAAVHPPGRLHSHGPADDGRAVLRPSASRSSAMLAAVRDALPGRARRQAARRARCASCGSCSHELDAPSLGVASTSPPRTSSSSSSCSRRSRSSRRSSAAPAAARRARREGARTVVEALFWPALLGYGEAAFAYTSARTSRAATWGVRIGWLAQTALLAVQAARADGFPWSTWAGSLNLFVWLVVGAYLIWGCRPRYRLLGLAVMPLAAGALPRRAARRRHRRRRELRLREPLPRPPRRARARGVRRLHARRGARGALPLGGAAAAAPRGRHPAAAAAAARDARAADLRTVAVSLPLLTLGLAAGIVRLRQRRRRGRRARGGDASSPGSSTARSSCCGRRAAAPRTSRSAASRS